MKTKKAINYAIRNNTIPSFRLMEMPFNKLTHIETINKTIFRLILFTFMLIPGAYNKSFSHEITGSFSSGFQTGVHEETILYSFIGGIIPKTLKTDSLIIESGFFNLPPVKKALFNDPPHVTSDSVVMALMDTKFKYVGIANDDETAPVISFKNYPSWMSTKKDTISGTVPSGCPDTSFLVIATDEGGLEDTLKVKVISVFQNRKPEITSHTEDSSFEGSLFLYVAKAEDPDLTNPKISFHDYPSWLTVSKDTIKGVPPENGLDTSFKVTATDGYLSDTITVTLKVISVDNPPVITSPSFVETKVLQEFSYTLSAEDPDSKPLLYFHTLPPWLKVDKDDSTTVRGIPDQAGDFTFMVDAIDAINRTSLEVTVRVKPINQAPEIKSDSLLLAIINSHIVYPVIVTDPEGDPVTLSISDLPQWLEYENDTIKGTAPSEETEVTFTINASDGEKETSLNARIIVRISNNPPKFVSDDEMDIFEDQYFSHQFIVEDPDSTPLTFKFITPLPEWISFLNDSIFGMPALPLPAPLGLKIVVSDGQHTDTQTVVLTVIPVNDPPVILSQPDTTGQVGALYSYQVRAEDEDDSVLVYKLTNPVDGMSMDSINGTLTWTPSDTQTGSHNIMIVVSDEENGADTQKFVLTIYQDTKPWCEIDEIEQYSRKDIKISYQIFDNDSDKISMDVLYRFKGQERWNPVTKITGNLKNIIYENYKGFFIWNSQEMFPDTILDSVKIRIVPSDTRIGYSSESNFFKLDNSKPLNIKEFSPEGTVCANEIDKIEISLSGARPDKSTVNNTTVKVKGKITGEPNYSVSVSDSSITIELKERIYTADTVTVTLAHTIKDEYGKSLDGNSNDIFENNASDNFTFSFETALPGDFDKDGEVGFGDLSYVAEYWLESKGGKISSDKIQESGPAKDGTVPNFIMDTDSLFDYEDLGVFIQMWHWCFYQEKSKDKSLAKTMAGHAQTAKHGFVNLKPDLVNRTTVLEMGVKSINKLVSFRYYVTYDPMEYRFNNFESGSSGSNTNHMVISAQKHEYGECEFEAAYLSATQPGLSGEFTTAVLELNGIPQKNSKIRIHYELTGSNHKTIEQGIIDLFPDEHGDDDSDTVNFVKDFTIVPNPLQISVYDKSLEFSHDPSIKDKVINNKKGTLFIVPIDQNVKTVSGDIRIYDWFGNEVIRTSKNSIKLQEMQKEIHIFWNGRNKTGMPVNRGIYNVVITLKENRSNRVLRGRVGVK